MTDPINTLIELNSITLHLNEVQSWIDNARTAAPTNQVVQLNLDREQTRVNEKRKMVALMMLDIRSRN